MPSGKILVAIVIIALLGIGSGFIVRGLSNARGQDLTNEPAKIEGFSWGVTVLNFPFPTYDKKFTDAQMAEARKLGVNTIRMDYVPSNPEPIDYAIAAARKNGLQVVLIIPFGPKDVFTNKNLVADTEAYVTDIVNRYKGKVAVYQLATEVGSVSLQNAPGKHGIDAKDYPAKDIAAITTWVKTASETVKKVDPNALRLVNDHWVHSGFFDYYFAQGGDFDILGWNWFSDMGTDMDKVVLDQKTGQTYQLLTKLKTFNKPIWLTEVNRRLGNQNGKDKESAEFITTMARYAQENDDIFEGFFVFNLVEDQVAPIQERGYGILKASNEADKQEVTGYTQAYDAYKALIKEYR